jgi:hypothetical protein
MPACSGAGCLDSGASGARSCEIEEVISSLSSSSLIDCGTLAIGASSAERSTALGCVRDALDSRAPFRLLWSEQGTDSINKLGLVGVTQDGALVVYDLHYGATIGWDLGWTNAMNAYWSPCATFSMLDGCTGTLDTCFRCEQRIAQQCACSEPAASGSSATIKCLSTGNPADAVRRPPCDSNACEFDGVCYPGGTGTEDGCCYCDKRTGGGCDQPAWCPGWVLIGKRCRKDADCSLQATESSGLHCRTDFWGERGVCTRDCNFGCPTGTVCVADVPDHNEDTVHNVCMRPCNAPADCAMEPSGNALGSECDAPGGLTKSYCF